MGRIGVALSDIPIFTSDNPRSEDPNKNYCRYDGRVYPADMQKVKLIPDRRGSNQRSCEISEKGRCNSLRRQGA